MPLPLANTGGENTVATTSSGQLSDKGRFVLDRETRQFEGTLLFSVWVAAGSEDLDLDGRPEIRLANESIVRRFPPIAAANCSVWTCAEWN